MIHGDCSSRGCYAMTDEQIAEIYALARESFFGGQRAFQIQAYPFRMTALNMAKHRNSPHMAFWRMLKQGNDHFEVTRHEPKVDVCEKRYVFDAETNGKFTPASKCPAYQVDSDVVAAVSEKQKRDDRQIAEYVNKGTPTVPVVTRTDGGMHPTFMAAFQKPYTDASGHIRSPGVSLPGTIPAHASPPREPEPATGSFANAQSSTTRVATAQATGDSNSSGNWLGSLFASNSQEQSSSGGVLDRMSRFVGLKGLDPAPESAPTPKRKAPPAKSTQTASRTKAKTEPATKTSEKASAKATANAGAIRPAAKAQPQEAKAEPPQTNAAPEPRPSSSAGLLNGSQPKAPTGSFDSRWGAFQ
jgi:hypothetical protein